MRKVSNSDARHPIARREEFQSHTGNFHGREHTPGRYVYSGHLDGRIEASTLSSADYVVFSYSTPIAWHLPSGWVVPSVTYSISTSRHQAVARHAARGDYSPSHLRSGWELGLGQVSSRILEAIRWGHGVDLGNRRRSTLQAVVDTGEAKWSDDGLSIVPTDDRHIRR